VTSDEAGSPTKRVRRIQSRIPSSSECGGRHLYTTRNRIFKLFESILDECLKNKHFKDYVNNRFDLDKYINIGGHYYALNNSILSVDIVQKEYSFEGIEGQVVLDIGGNIGGFAIPASTKAKHVYVVEPLFIMQLERNISYNNIANMTVFDIGLGDERQRLSYNEKRKTVDCIPLSKILNMCGKHVNFLKMDCEGGEWTITKNDLKGINRIEMELHCFNGEKIEDFLPILSNFDCKIEVRSQTTYLLHCTLRSKA